MAGVSLCKKCHKMGKNSAHNNPIRFDQWLRTNRPEQYKWMYDRVAN